MNISSTYYVAPENVFTELSSYMLADGFDLVLDLDKSHGSKLVEARSGKEYLDFFSCFGSMPIGFNHPKMLDQEFVNLIGRAALNKPSNSDVYTDLMATFVKTFHTIAVPEHFKYSFYIEGGALAVENALKAAFDWKVRKNFAKGYKEEKGTKIIHFRQAFHGRSGYTMSLTNTDPNKIMYFPKFDWPRITNPKLRFPITEDSLAETIKFENIAIDEIKSAFNDYKDDIAAIIIEPIQAEGGDNHFRTEFLQQLRVLADENEALLIFDEVQTGLGLSGTWWVHQQLGVNPDILSFGKKMQVCGILAGPKLDEVPDNVFKVSSRINSTWGGNLVDMVRSTKYLEIIHEENLVQNAKDQGVYLLEKVKELCDEFEGRLNNPRGRGLICAFDFINPEERTAFMSRSFDNGLFLLTCGDRSIRFRPHLNITRDEINQGFELIRKSL